jgi:uncharacterized protein YdhG (YjbR/CyaY superfamily)
VKRVVKSKTSKTAARDVDTYIAAAPKAVQPMLSRLRQVIRSAAPDAKERISYGMPSYEHHGRLAHFAGYIGHVGLYGVAHVASAHDDDVAKYLDGQSTLRFSVGKPLPVALVRRLIKARVKQNETER